MKKIIMNSILVIGGALGYVEVMAADEAALVPKTQASLVSSDKSLSSSKPETGSTSSLAASPGAADEVVGCLETIGSYVGITDGADTQSLLSENTELTYPWLKRVSYIGIGYVFYKDKDYNYGLLCQYKNKELCLGEKAIGKDMGLVLLEKKLGVKFNNPTNKSEIITATGYKARFEGKSISGVVNGHMLLTKSITPRQAVVKWVSPVTDATCKRYLEKEGVKFP